MAREGHSEDASYTLIRSTSLCLESQVKDGDDLHVSSRTDLSANSLPKGSLLESMLDDGLLQKRKIVARPRLPSFWGLGISSFEEQSARDSHASGAGCSAAQRKAVERPYPGSVAISAPRTGSTPLLTPPAELDPLKWNTNATMSPSTTSAIQRSVTKSMNPVASKIEITYLSDNGGPTENRSPENSGTGASEPHRESTHDNTTHSTLGSIGADSWLDRALGAAVMSIDPSNPSSNAIQVVSQTLPHPANESARPAAVFTEVIAGIQGRFGTSPQPYITITHAVPPRFDLLNLPSSPPSTPNIFAGRGDYFTQSVFAHAAVVPSYHLNSNSLATTPAPSSPNPIVPPSSVQISVLERYIPPGVSQECTDLFSLSGQSVLIDRLAELSPDKGSMLFVYPTRAGASTFASKYLGRVLDPLLRALVEVHQLSYGLAESLSSMGAVAGMHEFEVLKGKITGLCRRLTHRITSDTKRSRFNLVYASTGEVVIDRRTWTEWFLKQEHTRFKRTLESYWGRGKRLSQMDSSSAGTVLREFIDGVNKMTDEEAEQTGPGIELGVFVICRTSASSSV